MSKQFIGPPRNLFNTRKLRGERLPVDIFIAAQIIAPRNMVERIWMPPFIFLKKDGPAIKFQLIDSSALHS
jgi:hypothetical protein